MDSKREILVASLLAIALAAGLGTISYGFFAQNPPNVRIDAFSMKNGAASISFLPTDQVTLEAQLSQDDASIAGAPVTFEVTMPNNTIFLSQVVTTNKLGVADLTFNLAEPSDGSLGKWEANVEAVAYGQKVNATTSFISQLLSPLMDVYTQKGGRGQNAPGGTSTLNSTLVLYAEIHDSTNHPVVNALVTFEVLYSNATGVVPYTYLGGSTNASGIATASTFIRADPALATTWAVYGTAGYEDNVLIDALTFTVVSK